MRKQWGQLGVELRVDLQDSISYQSTITNQDYDVLLQGISLGLDSDVYVYWDSKNADSRSQYRLNYSSYKSAAADSSLEAGRTRSDPALRAIKYQSFLQAWRDDAPAVGLYQPHFTYITHSKVYGLTEHTINSETDRFANVKDWMIRTTGVSQTK